MNKAQVVAAAKRYFKDLNIQIVGNVEYDAPKDGLPVVSVSSTSKFADVKRVMTQMYGKPSVKASVFYTWTHELGRVQVVKQTFGATVSLQHQDRQPLTDLDEIAKRVLPFYATVFAKTVSGKVLEIVSQGCLNGSQRHMRNLYLNGKLVGHLADVRGTNVEFTVKNARGGLRVTRFDGKMRGAIGFIHHHF